MHGFPNAAKILIGLRALSGKKQEEEEEEEEGGGGGGGGEEEEEKEEGDQKLWPANQSDSNAHTITSGCFFTQK